MAMAIPTPKLTKEQLDKFLKDPEVVTLEILFVLLTLCNIFVLYRILLNICPFPIVVTWFQLLVGFCFAYILGEVSCEFPKCAFFPRLTIDIKLYEGLAMPTVIYLGMITMANVLLHKIPSVALFPVVVSLAVAFHHVSRFFGCGQIYLPIRWVSLGIMMLGFFLSIFDSVSMGISVFPLALIYALFSSMFRAWCLEKAMHVCNGRGNTLHNHKVVMGLVVLPFAAAIFGEWRVFTWMPNDFTRLYTWQAWGCLVIAGTLPFIKNVVANRMIRRTGQAPWRILEAVSMLLVFIIGFAVYDAVSTVGMLAFALVLSGRVLGMLDALSKDPNERRRAIANEPQHGSAPPAMAQTTNNQYGETTQNHYDPTGVADSFDRHDENTEDFASGGKPPGYSAVMQPRDDIEMRQQPRLQEAPAHSSSKPFLLMSPILEETQEARF